MSGASRRDSLSLEGRGSTVDSASTAMTASEDFPIKAYSSLPGFRGGEIASPGPQETLVARDPGVEFRQVGAPPQKVEHLLHPEDPPSSRGQLGVDRAHELQVARLV